MNYLVVVVVVVVVVVTMILLLTLTPAAGVCAKIDRNIFPDDV